MDKCRGETEEVVVVEEMGEGGRKGGEGEDKGHTYRDLLK